jgi:transcriptional regulator with XRE-family HTH domain
MITSLKTARERRGITQKELADRVNFNVNQVSMWERGEREMSEKNIKRLAQGLNAMIAFTPSGQVIYTLLWNYFAKHLQVSWKIIIFVSMKGEAENSTEEKIVEEKTRTMDRIVVYDPDGAWYQKLIEGIERNKHLLFPDEVSPTSFIRLLIKNDDVCIKSIREQQQQ